MPREDRLQVLAYDHWRQARIADIEGALPKESMTGVMERIALWLERF